MGKTYDANVNITIEVPDGAEEEFIDSYRIDDEDEIDVEDAISNAIEQEQPTFELGLQGVNGFMVAVERVSYLDG